MKDDATAPRWGVWLQLPAVKLWQAVALSIGCEPTEPLREAIFKGRAPDERAGAHVFELLKRWHYCEQALSFDGPIKPQGYGMANPPVCPVLLADVAAFLADAGFELPEELRALVLVRAEPAPTHAEPAEVAASLVTKASQAAQKEAREDARLAHCEAEGIMFDKASLRRLPDGIAKAAESLNPPISRQSLSTDVRAALRRRLEREKSGRG